MGATYFWAAAANDWPTDGKKPPFICFFLLHIEHRLVFLFPPFIIGMTGRIANPVGVKRQDPAAAEGCAIGAFTYFGGPLIDILLIG